MADVGSGTTITFGTTSWAGEVTALNVSGPSRPAVDVTDLADTSRVFVIGDVTDWGTIEVTYLVDTEDPLTDMPPIDATASETITIEFDQVAGGDTTFGRFSGSGFVTDGPTFTVGIDEAVSGTFTIKCTGAWSFTDSA